MTEEKISERQSIEALSSGESEVKRTLSFGRAVGVMGGLIIGSGIFYTGRTCWTIRTETREWPFWRGFWAA